MHRDDKPLPTDVRVRDDFSPALSAADPSRRNIPVGTPPSATEGVSGADTNHSPSTETPEDPLAASPFVWPTSGIVAWATNGTGHGDAFGDTVVVPGCDPSIMVTATSTYVGGVMTGYVAPVPPRA